MVHVSNGEGCRKMLAVSRPQQQTNTQQPAPILVGGPNNLNQLILQNIGKSSLKESFDLENNSNQPLPPSSIPGSAVGPLPSYKSNSLNLSCIIEEEPPPSMIMSNIVENHPEGQDTNANLRHRSSPPDSNRNEGSTVITITSTESRVITEELIVTPNGKKRGKRGQGTATEEKVSQSVYESAEGLGPKEGKPKGPAREKTEQPGSGLSDNRDLSPSSPTNGNEQNINEVTPAIPNPVPAAENGSNSVGTQSKDSPPHSVVKQVKASNGGTKSAGLKRVSFGSSKGSMVETLIFESPVSDERREIVKTSTSSNGNEVAGPGPDPNDSVESPGAVTTGSGGSTGGSRPPSRVRVTFFESEKPLAVSSPESDNFDYDLSNMTLPGSPNGTAPNYNRQMSTESGWDNPFRPDGDLSKEADQIVELIKEGKPINDETLRSKSPSVNEMMTSTAYSNILNASPGKGANGVNGGGMEVQRGVVVPASQAGQVEHVTLKKKKGCCVIQ